MRRGPLTGEEVGCDDGPKGGVEGTAHLAAVVSFQDAYENATAYGVAINRSMLTMLNMLTVAPLCPSSHPHLPPHPQTPHPRLGPAKAAFYRCEDVLTIVAADMLLWEAPQQADILVSELLGSFGDNELSPECLDGAQKFLKKDGVSIPQSYTSFLQPLTTAKLWNDVKVCQAKKEAHRRDHQTNKHSCVCV